MPMGISRIPSAHGRFCAAPIVAGSSETPSAKPFHNSQRGLPVRPLPRQTLSSGQVPRQALPLPRPEVPGPTPTNSFLAMHTSLLPLLQQWNHSLGAPPVLRTRRTFFFPLLLLLHFRIAIPTACASSHLLWGVTLPGIIVCTARGGGSAPGGWSRYCPRRGGKARDEFIPLSPLGRPGCAWRETAGPLHVVCHLPPDTLRLRAAK